MALNENGEWVDWQNTKVLQKLAILDVNKNVLMLRRSETGYGSRKGKWDLIGGSVEPEDLEDTHPHTTSLIREAREETQLDLTGKELDIVFTDSIVMEKSVGKVLMMALGYSVEISESQPKVILNNEHAEYAWMPIEDALKLDFGDDGGFHKTILERI